MRRLGLGLVLLCGLTGVGLQPALTHAAPWSGAFPGSTALHTSDPDTTSPDTTRRIERTLLPLLSYDSETGLSAGVLGQRYDERESYEPYYSTLRARVMVSTKGFYIAQLDHDTFAPFSGRLRATSVLYADRFLREPFFGSGNGTAYSDSLWDAGAYFYERRRVGLEVVGAVPVGDGPHSLLVLADALYDESVPSGDSTTLFRQLPPPHADGSGVVALGLGWRYDTRDDELIPRRGLFLETGLQASLPGIGPWSVRRFEANARHFMPLLRDFWIFGDVILAQQLRIHAIEGRAPHWLEPRLGSPDDLRGYPLNRFQGRASWLHMAELRSWFLEHPETGLRLGGQFFWDVGRVFGGGESYAIDCPPNADCLQPLAQPGSSDGLFDDLHHAYGFGGVLAPGGSDFFLRMDFGFSAETRRVVIGAGYAF